MHGSTVGVIYAVRLPFHSARQPVPRGQILVRRARASRGGHSDRVQVLEPTESAEDGGGGARGPCNLPPQTLECEGALGGVSRASGRSHDFFKKNIAAQ